MTVLERMTKAERLELAKVVRMRAKCAKDEADRRAARMLADFEAKLVAVYLIDHPAWDQITEEAKKYITEVDAKIAQRSQEVGIPERFRPRIHLGWSERGENGAASRRTELRKVAETELTARAKAAKCEIDRVATNKLTELAAGALESEDAKAFLESMPSIDDLMPPLELPKLEAKLTVLASSYY